MTETRLTCCPARPKVVIPFEPFTCPDCKLMWRMNGTDIEWSDDGVKWRKYIV
jgi:hypothetical protein